jgi:hypothetical protein
MNRVHIWQPAAELLSRLKFYLRFGHVEDVRRELVLSMANTSKPLSAWLLQDRPAPPADYATAHAKLRKALRDTDTRPDVQSAWREYEEAMERELIGPLLEQAAQTLNPVKKSLCFKLAELTRIVHVRAVLMGERLDHFVTLAEQNGGSMLPQPELREFLAMIDSCATIARESRAL